ncbi:T9SS type A sorting domain-containing protein [Portibacter lacus]|nr:T9SS type A sorting domain-containing protein [Portibacter lacus]
MKKFYQSIMAMLLISFCNIGLEAQITCKATLDLPLNIVGQATLNPSDMITGVIPSGVVLDQSSFSCADVDIPVTVKASIDVNGTTEFCTTVVNVIDDVPPVAVADLNVELVFPAGFSSIVLNPQVIDDGSYDQCGDVTLSVTPSEIFCEDIGSIIDVTLNVEDESGNINEAYTTLLVKGDLSSELTCNADIDLVVDNEFYVPVDLIFQSDGSCSKKELELFDDQGVVLSGNIIDQSQIGKTVTAILTRPADGTSCTTNINVSGNECESFYICDTKCNETTLGDCNSGHTTEDYVEWPCDLDISSPYPGFDGTSPENLVANYGIFIFNSEPTVVEVDCHSVGITYTDQVFYIEDKVKVVREWTIIEFRTIYVASYTQEILFDAVDADLIWNICDTNSNSSQVGDCGSGHSLDDDIEWPSDIASIDARIHPNQLKYISNVSVENTRPIFTNNEDEYNLTYEDQFIEGNENYSIVSRKWTVSSRKSSGFSADYFQSISVGIPDNEEDLVMVSTTTGRPMPNVSVNDVYKTNNSGVAVVSEDTGIELAYEDNPRQGLDVNDLVLLYDHILAKVVLNKFQQLAANITPDENISTLDVVVLQKYITGNGTPEKTGWDFASDPNFSNVKGNFVGYKYGDIDDSSILDYNLDELEKQSVVFSDILVNAGEEYAIDIRSSEDIDFIGAQFIYKIPETISILDVTFPNTEEGYLWFVDEDRNLRIVYHLDNKVENVDQDEVLFNIKFKSSENGVSADFIRLDDNEVSLFVTEDRENIVINGEVENEITSGNKDVVVLENVRITPNPAINLINVKLDAASDFQVNVFNVQGQKVKMSSETQLDISDLDRGFYIIKGRNNGSLFSSKFLKL